MQCEEINILTTLAELENTWARLQKELNITITNARSLVKSQDSTNVDVEALIRARINAYDGDITNRNKNQTTLGVYSVLRSKISKDVLETLLGDLRRLRDGTAHLDDVGNIVMHEH